MFTSALLLIEMQPLIERSVAVNLKTMIDDKILWNAFSLVVCTSKCIMDAFIIFMVVGGGPSGRKWLSRTIHITSLDVSFWSESAGTYEHV